MAQFLNPAAPRSATAPSSPPHYYNYAQRNNANAPQSRTTAFAAPIQRPPPLQQNPNAAAVQRLPEDQSIEELTANAGGSGGKSGSNLLTTVLIGLVVLALLVGGGIGLYFFMSKDHEPNKEAAKQKTTGNDTSTEESADEATEAAPGTAPNAKQGIVMHQIFFLHNTLSTTLEYAPSSGISYDTLESLEGIASLFAKSSGWKSEKGTVVNDLDGGVCTYLKEKKHQSVLEKIQNAESVRLCEAFRLSEDPAKPLEFVAINKQQQGCRFTLSAIVFSKGGKKSPLYALRDTDISKIMHAVNEHESARRRLATKTQLPSMADVVAQSRFHVKLPENYKGDKNSHAALMKAITTVRAAIKLAKKKPARVQEVHIKLTPHKKRHVQEESDQKQAKCNATAAQQSSFVEVKFALLINAKEYVCEYKLTPYVGSIAGKRRLSSDDKQSTDSPGDYFHPDDPTPPPTSAPHGASSSSNGNNLGSAARPPHDQAAASPDSSQIGAHDSHGDGDVLPADGSTTIPPMPASTPEEASSSSSDDGTEDDEDQQAQRSPRRRNRGKRRRVTHPSRSRPADSSSSDEDDVSSIGDKGAEEEEKPIYGDAEWWEQISNAPVTKCRHKPKVEAHEAFHTVCQIVEAQGIKEGEKCAGSRCLNACDQHWQIATDGSMLEVAHITAKNFQWRIEDENGNGEGGKNVPFWDCNLLETHQHRQPRRGLEEVAQNKDEENAPHKLMPSKASMIQNAYILIATTILCLVIGIQSFYWIAIR